MSKYLKEFNTHNQYEAFTATTEFVKPNVSYCKDQENVVHYNGCDSNGYEYVDLGFPSGLKWATKNIGANSPTDYGLYFQWGDIKGYTGEEVGSDEGQKYFGWVDYKYGNGTSSPSTAGISKYNTTDGKTTLEASDDAATVIWGGCWRIPNKEEFKELITNTTSAFTNGNLTLTSNFNGNTLILPSAGSCYNGNVNYVGTNGGYWESSLYTNNVEMGWWTYFNSKNMHWANTIERCDGYSIRPVFG